MIKGEFLTPPISKKRETGDALTNKACINMIVGPTGSGKSVLLFNLINLLEKAYDWDEALFVTGNGRDELLSSIEMDKTTNPSDLADFITKVKQVDKDPKYNLLVLDDLQGSPDFNLMLGRSDFTKFMLSHRHFGKVNGKGGTWVIATAQTLRSSFTPVIREQVSNWFLFMPRANNIKQFEEIADDKTRLKKAFSLLKAGPEHSFLFINMKTKPKPSYFLGFDKLLDLD